MQIFCLSNTVVGIIRNKVKHRECSKLVQQRSLLVQKAETYGLFYSLNNKKYGL